MKITVQTTVNAPIQIVWEKWITPEDICKWNAASPEWHTPRAVNDFNVGGEYSYRMEARDGSFGFDLNGRYISIEPYRCIIHRMEDDREVNVTFEDLGSATLVTEVFDAEGMNSPDLQQKGWQAILDNFRSYVERL